jgi:hypothetical protein
MFTNGTPINTPKQQPANMNCSCVLAILLLLSLLTLALIGAVRGTHPIKPNRRSLVGLGVKVGSSNLSGSVKPCVALFASPVLMTGSSPLTYISLYHAVANFLAGVTTGCSELQSGLQVYISLRNISPTSPSAPNDVQLAYKLSRNLDALAGPAQCRTTDNQQLATQFLIAADAPGCTPGYPGNCSGAACANNFHLGGLALGGQRAGARFETLLQLVAMMINPTANFSSLMWNKDFAQQVATTFQGASKCSPLYTTLAQNIQSTVPLGTFPAQPVVQSAFAILQNVC